MSLRPLKHHEAKLLKKVDFLRWKTDNGLRKSTVMQRYGIQRSEDYNKYSIIVGQIQKLANRLKDLDPADPFRIRTTDMLLQKLYSMGLIKSDNKLQEAAELTVSAFCRRRLPVIMVRLKMAQSLRLAITYIEQGHVRVGPETVTDPAFLVTRAMEDHVTWVPTSKIRKTILKYSGQLDDFEFGQN